MHEANLEQENEDGWPLYILLSAGRSQACVQGRCRTSESRQLAKCVASLKASSLIYAMSCRYAEAAKAGDLQFLQSKPPLLTALCSEEIGICAPRGGHLNILQWLSLQGADPGQQVC